MNNKLLSIIFTFLIIGLLAACGSSEEGSSDGDSGGEEDFPTASFKGVIPFSPGGSTDSVARSLAAAAEEELDQSIVIQNSPGGTGSIATDEVHSADSDGYTLLFAAENQNLYRTTGISDLSFNDFEPVILIGREVPVVVTSVNSEWDSLSDILDEVEDNPESVSMMTTGPVGISGVVTSMLDKEFNLVPYDGAGEGIAGVIGEQVDVGVVGLASAIDYVESGDLKVLSVINDEPLEELPDVPPLSEERPEYDKYLPWGPYYGVYVNADTPEPIVDELKDSFKTAWEQDGFQEFLEGNYIVPLGYSGEEALEFQQTWESDTNWLLHEAGEASDPLEFDIEKPE